MSPTKSIRSICLVGILAWVGTTNAIVDNSLNITLSSNTNSQRNLAFRRVPSLHEKPSQEQPLHAAPLPVATREEKCQRTNNGKLRRLNGDFKGCPSYKFTQFTQTWIPGERFAFKSQTRGPKDDNEARDWNKNLKIHGLWPGASNIQKSNLKFTYEASKAINKKEWPDVRAHSAITLYEHEWDKHGVYSGMSPLEYVNEVKRLQDRHPTPAILQTLTTQQTIERSTLQEAFDEKACLVCKKDGAQEYLIHVRYCFYADIRSHRAGGITTMRNCGGCPDHNKCKQNKILIMHEHVEDKKHGRNPQHRIPKDSSPDSSPDRNSDSSPDRSQQYRPPHRRNPLESSPDSSPDRSPQYRPPHRRFPQDSDPENSPENSPKYHNGRMPQGYTFSHNRSPW